MGYSSTRNTEFILDNMATPIAPAAQPQHHPDSTDGLDRAHFYPVGNPLFLNWSGSAKRQYSWRARKRPDHHTLAD